MSTLIKANTSVSPNLTASRDPARSSPGAVLAKITHIFRCTQTPVSHVPRGEGGYRLGPDGSATDQGPETEVCGAGSLPTAEKALAFEVSTIQGGSGAGSLRGLRS